MSLIMVPDLRELLTQLLLALVVEKCWCHSHYPSKYFNGFMSGLFPGHSSTLKTVAVVMNHHSFGSMMWRSILHEMP
jgi:hypothetical protein